MADILVWFHLIELILFLLYLTFNSVNTIESVKQQSTYFVHLIALTLNAVGLNMNEKVKWQSIGSA